MIRLFLATLLVSAVIAGDIDNSNAGPHAPPLPPGFDFGTLFGGPQPTNVPWRVAGGGQPGVQVIQGIPAATAPTPKPWRRLGKPTTVAAPAGPPQTPPTVPTVPVVPIVPIVPNPGPGLPGAPGAQVTPATVPVAPANPTMVVQPVNPNPPTKPPKGTQQGGAGSIKFFDPNLSNGYNYFRDAGSKYVLQHPDPNNPVRMVGNKKHVYVVNPVQTKDNKYLYDPWTIGQVLGFLYEYAEFNGKPPKDGWTIDLIHGQPSVPRFGRSAKNRRATLIFTPKSAKAEQKYWNEVMKT